MQFHKVIHYTRGMELETLAQIIIETTKRYELIQVTEVPFKGKELHQFYDKLTDQVGHCFDLGETEASESVGGKWTYVCYDPTIENAYRSTCNAQPLHTDGAYQLESPDATCMYCINTASKGGETVFLSGKKLLESLGHDDPELLIQLCTTPVCFSRKFENGGNKKTKHIIDQDEEGRIILTWNYYRVDPGSPKEIKQLCDAFHNYLQNKIMGSNILKAICLQPGEAVLWLDQKLLHGRNSFIANQYGERKLAKTCLSIKYQ